MNERNGHYCLPQRSQADPNENQSPGFRPIPFARLETSHSRLRDPVIDGILRTGETLNVIAPPKTGKSFLAGGLAWSVATGRHWLSHGVRQGKVLIVDNELHRETLVHRLGRIADSMEIPHDERDGIDIVSLRGQLASIVQISAMLEAESGLYRLIILDALYRTLPQGTSENDNAAMMAVYNHIDALAERTGTAIAVIHHTSKGAQGDKALTDIGAGAGAISRAADSHLAIREHETDGHFVLEAVTRSFKSPDPVSIRFDWPVWTATTLSPEVRRIGRQDKAKQEKADANAKQAILNAIPEGKRIQQSDLRKRVGFGADRMLRLIGTLIEEGKIKEERRRKKGGRQKFVLYSKGRDDSGNDSGNDSG